MNKVVDIINYDRKDAFSCFQAFLRYKVDHGGFKQIDIARAVNVRPEYVSRVYNGRQACSVQVQEKIVQYFGSTYVEAIEFGRKIIETGELPIVNEQPAETIATNFNGHNRRANDKILETDIVSFVSQWAAKKKEAEESLSKLQHIIENLSEGIVILDTDLMIEYQNRSHREMFGGSHIGIACNKAHGCEDYICECPSIVSKKTGMPASAIFPFKNGTASALTTPIRNGAGNITGYVTVIRDITQRQKLMTMAEKALEMLDRAVFVYDENLNIRFVNSKLKEITGASDSDLVTTITFLNYLKKNDTFKNYDEVEQIINKARKRRVEANVKICFSNGKKYLYNAKPMFVNDNEYIGRIGVFTPFD